MSWFTPRDARDFSNSNTLSRTSFTPHSVYVSCTPMRLTRTYMLNRGILVNETNELRAINIYTWIVSLIKAHFRFINLHRGMSSLWFGFNRLLIGRWDNTVDVIHKGHVHLASIVAEAEDVRVPLVACTALQLQPPFYSARWQHPINVPTCQINRRGNQFCALIP